MILTQRREQPAAAGAEGRTPPRRDWFFPSLAKDIAMVSIVAISMVTPFDFARVEARAACPPASAAAMVAWSQNASMITHGTAAAQTSQRKVATTVPKTAGTATSEEPGFFRKAFEVVKEIGELAWTAALALVGGIWAAGNVIWKMKWTLLALAAGFLILRTGLRLLDRALRWAVRGIFCGIRNAFRAARRARREQRQRALEDENEADGDAPDPGD